VRKQIQSIREHLRRLLFQPTAEMTRWQRTLRWWVDFSRHCAEELRHDRAGTMAAALTYHTLFSLLPTLVLALVVLQAFVGEAERQQFKQTIVDWATAPLAETAPPTDPGEPAAVAQPRPDTTNERTIAADQRQRELREARETMDERLEAILRELEGVNFGSIGVVGLLIFVFAATQLLSSIESSFNKIFGVRRARPWYLRIPLYYTVITLGPLVLIAGQVGQRRVIEMIVRGDWTGWLAGPVVVLAPVLTTWLVLGLMYTLLPHTKVKLRPAAIGSLIAALLWVIAIEGLAWYVDRATTTSFYGAVYGGLALLPLFLLWLWITWLIVLFGLEVTYTLQAMRGRRFKHVTHKPESEVLVDAAWLAPLMANIARRFAEGRMASPEELGRELGLPTDLIQRMLAALAEANLVHRVGGDDEQGLRYTLGRPAERITVGEVLEAADAMCGPTERPTDPRARKIVRQVRRQRDADGTRTLAELAAISSEDAAEAPAQPPEPEDRQ